MSDVAYFILVLVIASIIIFGVAYWMDKYRKKGDTKVQAPLGPVSLLILWVSRGILIITILALIGSFLLNEIIYAKLAWNFLLGYIILGFMFQSLRRKGI
jgi:heme/copper-type cytochrome/quinol oxidase subunit 2